MVIGFPILKVIASVRPSAVVVMNLAHTSDLDKVCERADFEETNEGTG